MTKESVLEVSQKLTQKYGRTPFNYGPQGGGAVSLSSVASGIKRAAGVIGSGAKTVAKTAATSGVKAGKFYAEVKAEEWKRKKLGGSEVPFDRSGTDLFGDSQEPFYARYDYGPNGETVYSAGEAFRGTQRTAGRDVQVEHIPYPAICMDERVMYGVGAKVLRKGDRYFCPHCGRGLVTQ